MTSAGPDPGFLLGEDARKWIDLGVWVMRWGWVVSDIRNERFVTLQKVYCNATSMFGALADPGGGAPRPWPPPNAELAMPNCVLASPNRTVGILVPIYQNVHQVNNKTNEVFGVFEVQYYKVFFRMPKCRRNWMFPLVRDFFPK